MINLYFCFILRYYNGDCRKTIMGVGFGCTRILENDNLQVTFKLPKIPSLQWRKYFKVFYGNVENYSIWPNGNIMSRKQWISRYEYCLFEKKKEVFSMRFFFFSKSRGKKNRKILQFIGRKEVQCDYQEIKKTNPLWFKELYSVNHTPKNARESVLLHHVSVLMCVQSNERVLNFNLLLIL